MLKLDGEVIRQDLMLRLDGEVIWQHLMLRFMVRLLAASHAEVRW